MRGFDERRAATWAMIIVMALTFLRLYVVQTMDLNLGPDEAQYWWWSKDLAFGYYSKPPMIAWIIAGTTSYCGDGEACVRSASPLIYAIASAFIFAATRIFYDWRTAFWACIAFATLPGVSFSSGLITTDVPLLMFWAIALFCVAHLLNREPGKARVIAVVLGIVIGLAMLSKYAGAYFFLGLGVASLFDRRIRAHVLGLNGALIFIAALIVFSPNIVWNMQHGFATVSHTAYNAGIKGDLFHIGHLFDFFGAQFGVFGPILMGTIVLGLALGLRRSRWPQTTSNDVVLLSLSVPVVIVGLTIAFISKANANWSAPAYVGLTMVAVAWLLRDISIRWLQASTAIAVIVGGLLYAFVTSPRFAAMAGNTVPFIQHSLDASEKQQRGWKLQVPSIIETMKTSGIDTLMAEDREDMASLLYYTRDSGIHLVMWTDDKAHPSDHFQMTMPYAGTPPHVAFITRRDDSSDVTSHFDEATEIAISTVSIGKDRTRTFHLIDLSGPK